MLLIMSDMQFNCCTGYDDRAIQMIRRKYNDADYEMPNVVFWNLNAADNVPCRFDEKGVALVSGFSPAIMKSVLAADLGSADDGDEGVFGILHCATQKIQLLFHQRRPCYDRRFALFRRHGPLAQKIAGAFGNLGVC